ncbi:MAG: hypothetical protein JO221_09995, partial [Sphingomonas sp.]|nr:hypothetical protein [Sphingomonas sp.]
MAISRAKVAAAALVAASLAAAAVAQSNKNPESLLPPGFDEPPAAPAAAPGKTPAAPSTAPAAPTVQPLPSLALGNSSEPAPTPSATPTPDAAQLAQYEMPPFARRSLSLVGPTGTTEGGLAPTAWGNADGRYLEILMRRLSAPLPSRWLSIALRRALLSQVDTPYGLNGADFAAERAWLLLRMGESVSARALVQSVDTANVSPKLRDVWMNAALATADPGALCPLTDAALRDDNQPGWVLAQAMCTALVGNPGEAQPLIAQARRAHIADGIDLQLAQKVVGAGADSRQAITIEWTPV